MLESFLVPMLDVDPEKRAAADIMLPHDWLRGVVVQGEIELHLRQEEEREETQRRIDDGKATAMEIGLDSMSISKDDGGSSHAVDKMQGVVNAASVDPELVTALKPVEEPDTIKEKKRKMEH